MPRRACDILRKKRGNAKPLPVKNPTVPSMDSDNPYAEELPSFDEMERDALIGSGYSENSKRFNDMMESTVADSDGEKIFTIDKYRSYGLEDATDEILKDEVFNEYLHALNERLDPDADAELLEQWTPEFIRDKVMMFMSRLSKGEKFYYAEFFRELLSESSNDEAVNLVDFNDKVFDEMPDAMRLF